MPSSSPPSTSSPSSAAPTPPAPPRPVPLFELATQWQVIRNDVEAAVKEVLDTQQYTSGATSGPFVGRFEEHLGRIVNAQVIALSSGTDAILAALMALGVGRDENDTPHEVITTPFTFFATAGCIVRAGARPVFVDIDPATFLMDLKQTATAITPRTRAIVPVHLYGQMLDTAALAAIAKPQKLAIIEDAAQCIGARDQHGHQIAENAACACLSFYPTKNLGAAGDAGALVTRDSDLATRFRQTRQHGETERYHHSFVGGNFRMDALQAAVLNVKLKWLTQWNDRRRAIAAYYTQRFITDSRGAIIPPAEIPGAFHVYHQYVIRVPGGKRDALRDHLSKNGVGSNIYYPKPLHLQTCFANLGYKKGDFPITEKACDEVLALPIFPELTDSQLERVANTVLSFFH
ncbi:MAG TPA: DegT/DnrJ/EryC1/StrS family aminotransferase [Phycisphaerae bacterium]|nr:DegT/DnrJ/EryC1/StrS family aminotransferase [Phycisphaerae bacterium]